MELSPRLARLAEEVPAGSRFADIGTDHAFLPVHLLQQGIITSAIASDLREGPLERARETARRFGLEERISFRLCDGLAAIHPWEVDVLAIAGMGGETIAAILERAAWTREGEHLFLLQPMSAIPFLRGWLQEHGFEIVREHIVLEGQRFYIIMLARAGQMPPLSLGERWAGRQTPDSKEPLRQAYLADQLRRVRRALAGVERSAKPEDIPRRRELSVLADQLAQMEKEWKAWHG